MIRFLLAIGIGLPILGGLFAWYGIKERNIASASSETPETIALSKLIARGPEGNANIILTDYVPTTPHVIQRGRRGRYSGVWIPVVPKDSKQPNAAAAPKVFVYSSEAGDPEEAYERLSNPQLPGMVSNKILTPNSGAMDDLEEQFPQTDFSTCIFIHEGREPASAEKSALMFIGGVAAIVIGLWSLGLCLYLWQKRKAEGPRKKERKKQRDRDEDDEDRPRRRRASDEDEDDDDRSSRNRRTADDEEDRPRRRPRDEDDDDRPRRRSRRDDD
jgi:hypothetical protein